MRKLLVLALLSAALAVADDRWIEIRYGPFVVITSGSEKAGKEALNRLEQFRNAFGLAIGNKDPQSPWPIVVVLPKKPLGTPARFRLSRDSYIAEGLSTEAFADLGRILLDANTGPMPPLIEEALITLYSTLQVSGTHITLGEPPVPDKRTKEWARLHLLATDPRYGGRMRVFLYNLQQTWDFDPAYRNAFERTKEQIDQESEVYFKAGKFGTADVSGRAISAEREFYAKQVDAATARLANADLLLGISADKAKTEYKACSGVPAQDGIALATLAPADLKAAVDAGSTNARVWLEYGVQKKDKPAIFKAGQLNKKWAEPHARLAVLEQDPGRKAQEWKLAAQLDPRKPAYWQSLAESATDANMFADASKAWLAAERAARTDEERERVRAARLAIEDHRLAQEEAERRRIAEEKEREINRLKDESLRSIREAEMRANKDAKPLSVPVVPWSEVNGNPKVRGTLQRVDCIGEQARLVIRTPERKTVSVLVVNPNKAAITGKGSKSLECGVQRPARLVSVEYVEKPDAKSGTVGEAATIEFQ